MIKNRDKDKVVSLLKILFITTLSGIVWLYFSPRQGGRVATIVFSNPDTTCHKAASRRGVGERHLSVCMV
jgi:hypothetical protein